MIDLFYYNVRPGCRPSSVYYSDGRFLNGNHVSKAITFYILDYIWRRPEYRGEPVYHLENDQFARKHTLYLPFKFDRPFVKDKFVLMSNKPEMLVFRFHKQMGECARVYDNRQRDINIFE